MARLRGDRLKAARERLEFSQEEAAHEIGIKQQNYGRYENEQVDPSTDMLVKIATGLKVSTDYLLGLSDENGDSPEEQQLSPLRRKLLWALDKGHIVEALEIITAISKGEEN